MQKARIRLNQAQRARLELSYLRNPNWSNEEIQDLANLIKIPFTKVYKWNWERKKKDRKQYTLYELASLYPEIGPESEYVSGDEAEEDEIDATESENNEANADDTEKYIESADVSQK